MEAFNEQFDQLRDAEDLVAMGRPQEDAALAVQLVVDEHKAKKEKPAKRYLVVDNAEGNGCAQIDWKTLDENNIRINLKRQGNRRPGRSIHG